jgi:hypothetical protein
MKLKTNKNGTKWSRKEIKNQKNKYQIKKYIYHKLRLKNEIENN